MVILVYMVYLHLLFSLRKQLPITMRKFLFSVLTRPYDDLWIRSIRVWFLATKNIISGTKYCVLLLTAMVGLAWAPRLQFVSMFKIQFGVVAKITQLIEK